MEVVLIISSMIGFTIGLYIVDKILEWINKK